MPGTLIETEKPKRLATTVDLHVGSRIRALRKQLGISQQHLAEQLGLTFQQIQKYERGRNRVSASRLYQTAGVLHVPVSYFFEGLDDQATDTRADTDERKARAFLKTDEGAELARTFPRLSPGDMRKRVLELVRCIIEVEESSTTRPPPAPRGAPNAK